MILPRDVYFIYFYLFIYFSFSQKVVSEIYENFQEYLESYSKECMVATFLKFRLV